MSLRGVGDEPLIYYTDPMKLMTHINEVHGAEAVNGMAGLMAWCQAPTRALGRFDAGQPPKTLDEMYACATNEFERSTITDMLFGSVTDVLDRYLPDKEKHGALRGMLSLLAVNTTYRGPATPGTAAALAFGFAVPDENALLVKKLKRRHRRADGAPVRGVHVRRRRVAAAQQGRRDPGRRRPGHRGPPRGRLDRRRADRRLRRRAGPDGQRLSTRARCPPTSANGSPASTTAAATCRCTSRSTAYRSSPQPYEVLNDPAMQSNIGIFCTPEELQQQWEDCRRGIVPADPSIALQIPSVNDPDLAPPGKHAASAFSLWFPVEESHVELRRDESRDGAAGDRQDHPARTELRGPASSGTPPSRPGTWARCSARPAATTATA